MCLLSSTCDESNGIQTVTIFAYGVTSSGKTHTMQGTPKDPGVIPRVVEVCRCSSSLPLANTDETYIRLFWQRKLCRSTQIPCRSPCRILRFTKTTFTTSSSRARMCVSIPLYPDLTEIHWTQAPKLPVREGENGLVFVAGLVSTPIASVLDFQTLYE